MQITGSAFTRNLEPQVRSPIKQDVQFGASHPTLANQPAFGTPEEKAVLAQIIQLMKAHRIPQLTIRRRFPPPYKIPTSRLKDFYSVTPIYNAFFSVDGLKINVSHDMGDRRHSLDGNGRILDTSTVKYQPGELHAICVNSHIQDLIDALKDPTRSRVMEKNFPILDETRLEWDAIVRQSQISWYLFGLPFVSPQYQHSQSKALQDIRTTLAVIWKVLGATPRQSGTGPRIHVPHSELPAFQIAASTLNPGSCRMGGYFSADGSSPLQRFIQNIAEQLKKGDYNFPASDLNEFNRKGLRTVYERTRDHYSKELPDLPELPPEPRQ